MQKTTIERISGLCRELMGCLVEAGMARETVVGGVRSFQFSEDASKVSPEDVSEARRLADKLSDIMFLKYGQDPKGKVYAWANTIRNMHSVDGVSFTRIDEMLDWYEKHSGEKFVPVIRGAQNLRTKWNSLCDAAKRETTAEAEWINEKGIRCRRDVFGRVFFTHPSTGQPCSEDGSVS